MKFYVLCHPDLGYLRSKTAYSIKWTENLERAKKWNQKNHPSNVRSQGYAEELKECEVVEIEYEIGVI